MASAQKNKPPLRKPGSVGAGSADLQRPLKIGEAAKLVGAEPYVLRFWETQFAFIRPKQSRSRHRYYAPADVEALKIVKRLLHTEGYTIAGARKFIRENGLDGVKKLLTPTQRATSNRKSRQPDNPAAPSEPDSSLNVAKNGIHRALREIRDDLRALHKLLRTS
jgi:DNA-binding transcriptional MerR regulator